MIVVAIDVGILNLGLVHLLCDSEFKMQTIITAKKVDITRLTHNVVSAEECQLPHTNLISDRVNHFCQEHGDMLDAADHILIEKQPFTGLNDVEALLHSKYRSKAELIYPRSMHKHFRIGHLDYEGRKERTVQLAEKYVGHTDMWMKNDRKHDIADAMCIFLFWAHQRRDEQKQERHREKMLNRVCGDSGLTFKELLEKYRYKGGSKLINKREDPLC